MATRKIPKKTKGKKAIIHGRCIYILEGLEPVRKMPGMYIGSTGVDGLPSSVREIFDNSRDEAMGGHSNEIELAILPGEKIRVPTTTEAFQWISISKPEFRLGNGCDHASRRREIRRRVLQDFRRFARCRRFGGQRFVLLAESGGASNGGKHIQEYKIGEPQAKVKESPSEFRGTVVTFEPDPKIFSEIKFSYQTILNHLRQQAYLVKN